MLAGLREILIIVAPHEKDKFVNLLGSGEKFGVNFKYAVQPHPEGLAQSLIIAEEFLHGDSCCLILGDNIFHGAGLGRALSRNTSIDGAHIFGYPVVNTSAYGIATLSKDGKVLRLEEKPNKSDSNLAIPGLYFFDSQAPAFAKIIKPSPRGELEILDVLERYRVAKKLTLEKLPFGTAWFDSGTFTDMHDAASYVRIMEERTGIRVGDPEEVARIQGWVG